MRIARFILCCASAGVPLAISACGGSSTPAAPIPLTRGAVTSLSKVLTYSPAAMNADPNGAVAAELAGPAVCAVTLYAIDYQTVGVSGERANASAALFVPQAGCNGPFPLVGYAHGTNVVKAQKITQPSTTNPQFTPPDQLPIAIAAFFAAHGYVTVATDYLGLGDSTYPYHPYLQGASEATSVEDSLRAARNAAKTIGIALSGQVLLTGHSQGGHSAVWTQRIIESSASSEFDIAGNAPSSGPYDLTQTFLDSIANQSQDAPILATYILTGYQKAYQNVYTTGPTDVFQNPWAGGIDSLLPVATFQDEVALEGKTLPLSLSALLQASWESSFTSNAQSPARVDTAMNDLVSGWAPKAPLFLCGGSRDPEVEFKNATIAQKYFASVGNKVTLLDVNPYIPPSIPLVDYHVTVADFCLPLARKEFFDPLVASGARARRTTGASSRGSARS